MCLHFKVTYFKPFSSFHLLQVFILLFLFLALVTVPQIPNPCFPYSVSSYISIYSFFTYYVRYLL